MATEAQEIAQLGVAITDIQNNMATFAIEIKALQAEVKAIQAKEALEPPPIS